jgi:hypothetical protein
MIARLAVVALAVIASPLAACTVLGLSAEEVAKSELLLRVLVTEVRLVTRPSPDLGAKRSLIEVHYEVLERLKGTPPSSKTFRTQASVPGECGALHFLAGFEYLLAMQGGKPEVSLRGTEPLYPDVPGAQERLQELRKLTGHAR